MKKYNCQFPNCLYQTNDSWQIHEHHIQPKEHNGENKKWNTILLCPTHHSKIYIPNTHGIHKSLGEDSIQIICWRNNGSILEYKDKNGITHFHSY